MPAVVGSSGHIGVVVSTAAGIVRQDVPQVSNKTHRFPVTSTAEPFSVADQLPCTSNRFVEEEKKVVLHFWRKKRTIGGERTVPTIRIYSPCNPPPDFLSVKVYHVSTRGTERNHDEVQRCPQYRRSLTASPTPRTAHRHARAYRDSTPRDKGQ